MNTRTGERACDVGFPPHATSLPVALATFYNGAAMPDVSIIQGWNIPALMFFESDPTRAYAGFDAGVTDAQYTRGVAQRIGYPATCGVGFCAADARSTPAQFLANIGQYAAGWRTVFPVVPLTPYGNPDARRAAAAGAGGAVNQWGIGTWDEGEGGGPNQPPDQSECALLQSGNTPGPAPGTDLDWLYAPVAVFGAWGGPVPTTPEEDEVKMYQGDKSGVILLDGANAVRLFQNEIDAYKGVGVPLSVIPQPQFDALVAVSTRLQQEGAVDPKAIADEVAKLLPAGKALTGTATVELHSA